MCARACLLTVPRCGVWICKHRQAGVYKHASRQRFASFPASPRVYRQRLGHQRYQDGESNHQRQQERKEREKGQKKMTQERKKERKNVLSFLDHLLRKKECPRRVCSRACIFFGSPLPSLAHHAWYGIVWHGMARHGRILREGSWRLRSVQVLVRIIIYIYIYIYMYICIYTRYNYLNPTFAIQVVPRLRRENEKLLVGQWCIQDWS